MTRLTGKEIATMVAEEFGLTFAQISSARRTHRLAHARQLAMLCVRQFCPHLSLPAIGRLFGGRDHTTVIYSLGRARQHIRKRPEFAQAHANVLERVRGIDLAVRRELAQEQAARMRDWCDRYAAALRDARAA